MRGAALVVSAAVWLSSSAEALTPVAQDRHVFGREEDGFGNLIYADGDFVSTETRSAPDYAPFTATTDGFFFPFEGPTIAAQNSTIGADQLDASGNTVSQPPSNPLYGYRIIAESVYSVTFDVEHARPYTLSGQIDVATNSCWGTAEAPIRLSGASGTLAGVSYTLVGSNELSEEDSVPLSTTLLLPAGTYTLEAWSRTDASGGIGPHGPDLCDVPFGERTSRYEVHLAPAPPVVPALPAPWSVVLATALALSARARRR